MCVKNVNSLINKVVYCCNFCTEHNIDIFGITESWLQPNISDSVINIPGYRVFRKDCISPHPKHGVCLYAKESVRVLPVDTMIANVLAVRLLDLGVVVVVVYRPPSNSQQENESLLREIERLSLLPGEIILLGDFNLPNLDWSEDFSPIGMTEIERQSFRLFSALGLTQWVHEGTYLYSNNILDLVLTSENDRVVNLELFPPFPHCGHLLVKFEWLFSLPPDNAAHLHSPKGPPKYLWSHADFASIKRELIDIDWEFEFCFGNVNDNYTYLSEVIKHCMLRHVPTRSPASRPRQWKPKVDSELSRLKSQSWQKYKLARQRHGRNSVDAITALTHFHDVNSRLHNDLTFQCAQWESHLVLNLTSQPKQFHKYIRLKRQCRPCVGPLMINGHLSDDPASMAESLCAAFGSVFSPVSPPDTLPHRTIDAQLSTVRLPYAKIVSILKGMREDTSPGPDVMLAPLLKNCASQIAIPLTLLFKKSLNCSKLPKIWKSALVCPIYKKGTRSDPLNYRPISLTALTCKTMERIIAQEIMKYLEQHEVIGDCQFGFRPGFSAVEQLVLVYDRITAWYDQGNVVNLILFDFSKAFDRVNHRLLLRKLSLVGLTDPLLGWLGDFLMGRLMSVSIEGQTSSPLVVSSGVPQGSVLGPLLFLVFVDHLVASVNSCHMLFADDLKLYFSGSSSMDVLQSDIDLLYTTATDWGLKFNAQKCVNLRFARGSAINHDLFHLDDSPIAITESHQDLGVLIDSNLKFHSHCQSAASKAGGVASALLRTTVCWSKEFMLALLTTHIRPVLEYGSPVWSTGFVGDVQALESVQRRWTRHVVGLADVSYPERLKRLDLFSVSGRLWRADMLLVYKIFHSLSKIEPLNIFTVPPCSITRGHGYKVHPLHCSTEARRRFFSSRVTASWNNLPACVVNAPNLTRFKSLLALHCHDRLFEC